MRIGRRHRRPVKLHNDRWVQRVRGRRLRVSDPTYVRTFEGWAQVTFVFEVFS
jgi:hypothetical protein